MKRNKNETAESKRWLKNIIKPYRGAIAILTVTSVLAALSSVAFAYITQFLVNGATDGKKHIIITLACVLVAVLIFRIAIRTLNSYLTEKYRVSIANDLSRNAFDKTLKGQIAKISSYHSGELMNRIIADSREIAADTVAIVPVTAGLVAQFAGCLIALLTTDVLFTLILIGGGAVIFGLSVLFRTKLKAYQKKIMSLDGECKSFIQESLTSAGTIKAYGAEQRTADKSGRLFSAYASERVARAKTYSFVNVLYSLVSNMGLLFAVIWCVLSVLGGDMKYGAILSVILLMEQLQRPLTSFASVMPVVYARAASAERLYEIEIFNSELCTEPTISYENLRAIVFDNVSFAYGKKVVLKGMNCSFEKGRLSCLTGSSGAGKSTTFKLMLALYSPDDGNIYLEDNDGKRSKIGVGDRRLFAYVPQGNYMFSGTIRENLTFFAPEGVSDEDIRSALITACADFVYDLPGGIDGKLGERGAGLSEGQIQRLAVARALLSTRPILLLDEATSALDEETEKRLINNLKALANRTIICITHRPAAVSVSDKAVKIEHV